MIIWLTAGTTGHLTGTLMDFWAAQEAVCCNFVAKLGIDGSYYGKGSPG